MSYHLLSNKTLPLTQYSNFFSTLVEQSQAVLRWIFPKLGTEKEEFAKTIVRALRARGDAVDVIKRISAMEIRETDDPNIIFRGNSMATKLMDYLMKKSGLGYLHLTISGVILKVAMANDISDSCEVDPLKITAATLEEKDIIIKKNWKRLLKYIGEFWNAIRQSSEQCPWYASILLKYILKRNVILNIIKGNAVYFQSYPHRIKSKIRTRKM